MILMLGAFNLKRVSGYGDARTIRSGAGFEFIIGAAGSGKILSLACALELVVEQNGIQRLL